METRTLSDTETGSALSRCSETQGGLSLGGDGGFHGKDIWEMDPGVIVTTLNNQEGPAGAAGQSWAHSVKPSLALTSKAGRPFLEQ